MSIFQNIIKGTYEGKIICGNCGKTSTVKIPRGTPADEWIKSDKSHCPICGCRLSEEI